MDILKAIGLALLGRIGGYGVWAGFEVGEGDDFEREVELTGQNAALLKFLAERRSRGQRISLAEVKEQLGLE